MFCTHCGAEFITDEPFCLFCGLDNSEETPLSFEQRLAERSEKEPTAHRKSIMASKVRTRRSAYLLILILTGLVAAFFIYVLTLAWYSDDPQLVASRPHMSSAKYFLILYSVVLGLWLVIYIVATILLAAALPKGIYRKSLIIALSVAGILPGIFYMLNVASRVTAETPKSKPMLVATDLPVNSRNASAPPPPRLPRKSRGRRSTIG